MKVTLLTPIHRAVFALFIVLVVAGHSLCAQQTAIPAVREGTAPELQNWDPFNDALLYFTNFSEIQRVDRWVFTTGTVGTHMSALVPSGTAASEVFLPVYSVPSAPHCVQRCTRKGEIFMYFHAGGDRQTYEQARRTSGVLETWDATITVKVRGLDAASPISGELFSYIETLVVDQEHPERLVVKDASQYFQGICNGPSGALDKIEVTVLSYIQPTVVPVQAAIRLEVGFKEELNIDAKPSNDQLCTQPSIIEYPSHFYSEDAGKYTIESRDYFSPFVNPAATVTFRWNIKSPCTADSFPNWQFQLLKLYNTDKTVDNSDPTIRRLRSTIDWSKALTLETGSKKQEIALTIPEGEGMYIWRVRPIGNYYEGEITNPQNWGCWSASPQNGDQILAEYQYVGIQPSPYFNRVDLLKESGTSFGPWSAFYYRQFDNDKNWSYQRSFAETGTDGVRIGEGIVYANDMLSPTQVQAKTQSDNTVVAAQSVYDFAGRPTLQTLPAPLPSQTDFRYKPLFLTNPNNSLYRADNFDVLSVPGVPQAASLATGVVSPYYSSSNTDKSIPSAEGYPFATSRFYKDGRLKEQGGVGAIHQVGQATPRTGRIFYSAPTDRELVSIFGDEAPAAETVSKIVTLDPNNVASAQYISRDGMLLATCLVDAGELPASLDAGNIIPANAATPLMNLEGETVNVLSINDDIHSKNGILIDANSYRVAKTYTFAKPTPIQIDYRITPKKGQHGCLNYCMTCDYKVQVRVINVETGAVVWNTTYNVDPSGNLTSVLGCTATGEQHPIVGTSAPFPLTVGPGSFIVERTIVTNNLATNPVLPASEWHIRKAMERIRPLEQILQELHLVPAQSANLDAYNQTREGKGNIYSWNPLVQDGYNVAWCGGLPLPSGYCPNGCPVAANTFPEFEKYIAEKLGDINPEMGLNTWFRNSNGSDKYPSGSWPTYLTGYSIQGATTEDFPLGQRMFDELISNMIASGYDCKQLWKCLEAVVAQFKGLRGANNGGVPSVTEGVTYDLLQAFLDCATTTCKKVTLYDLVKEGVPTEYGTPASAFGQYSTHGYLSHAHEYFQYTNAASPCSTMVAAIYGPYPWPYGSPAWKKMYTCINASKDIPQEVSGCMGADNKPVVKPQLPINTPDKQKQWDAWVACMTATTEQVQEMCESRCEKRRPEFEKAVKASYPGIPPVDLACMIEALMHNCTDGCSVELTVAINPNSSVAPYPFVESDVAITINADYEAIERRIAGTFKVAQLQGENCPVADPEPYVRASSPSTQKVLDLLAQHLTKVFNAAATATPFVHIDFFDEAKKFLELSGLPISCLSRSDVGNLLHSIIVRPDAKATFSTHFDDRGTPSNTSDDCCDLFFQSTWQESLVAQAEGLNSFLDHTWGQALPAFSPNPDVVTNTAYLNYSTSDTVIVPASLPHYQHAYYQRIIDPLSDSVRLYGNGVNSLDTSGLPTGIANFKILPGRGDDDFSNELNGVIASKTTDAFAVYDPGNSNSGVWRNYGTVVIQLPRKSLSDPVQKLTFRLTRAAADSNNLQSVRVEKNIGFQGENALYTTTRSGDEVTTFVDMPFTESLGHFVVTPEGELAFSTLGVNAVTIPFVGVGLQYTRTASALVRFDAADCILCQPTSCGVCIAWQPPKAPDLTGYPAFDFTPMDCEQKEIERIKAIITESYRTTVEDIEKQVRVLYAESCGKPSEITDKLTVSYPERLYHYTLFYYDRAGQLVRTVPPKGVVDFASTDRMRHPQHTMETRYDYNTFGQLVRKTTPDEGSSQLWYDSKGRVRFSQKAYQVAGNRYLYFNYDYLGRMVETGEFTSSNIAALLEVPVTTGDKYIRRYGYDNVEMSTPFPGYPSINGRNYRNRLAEVVALKGSTLSTTGEDARTIFSYDEHGNMEWSLSSAGRNSTGSFAEVANKTEYDYNLGSGTITKVAYRKGFADQFFWRYNYDADNRLVSVESSRDDVLWEQDASYSFYKHGPLRRTMLGADSVQGIDYAYTIQGWLKSINHPSLLPSNDPGGDGNAINGVTNTTKFAKDAFGMALGYFPGDFQHTGSPLHSGSGALAYNLNAATPLYDGTITSQTSFIRPPTGITTNKQLEELVGYTYRYDRLYRLRHAAFAPYQYPGSSNWFEWGDYEAAYKYDANGNFTYLRRWGRAATPLNNVYQAQKKVDEFDGYVYTLGTNRLQSFTETSAVAANYTDDIDAHDMASDNYQYDVSGRLIKDKKEGVEPTWDVYDKVVEVINHNGPIANGQSTPSVNSRKIRYVYDAAGQRVRREVYHFNATNGDFDTSPSLIESYVYGAGGELLGVYEQTYENGILQNPKLKEWPLYGGGRVGVALPSENIEYTTNLKAFTDKYSRVVDKKRYEIADHLGNVRVVVSDLKLDDGSGSFLPDEKSYTNFYPYGMPHPNRSWEVQGDNYRYGFNGVEKEGEVYGKGNLSAMDFRMYDSRVGRWWGVDKIVKVHESPYAAMAGNPINFADPSGLQVGPGADATTPTTNTSTDNKTPVVVKTTDVKTESTGGNGNIHVENARPTTSEDRIGGGGQPDAEDNSEVKATKDIKTVTDMASERGEANQRRGVKGFYNEHGNQESEDIVMLDKPKKKFNLNWVTEGPFSSKPTTVFTLFGTDEATMKQQHSYKYAINSQWALKGTVTEKFAFGGWDAKFHDMKLSTEFKGALQFAPRQLPNPLSMKGTFSPFTGEIFAAYEINNKTGESELKFGHGAKISSPQILVWSLEGEYQYSRKYKGINFSEIGRSLLPPTVPNTATIKAPVSGFYLSAPFLPTNVSFPNIGILLKMGQ